MQTIRVEGLIPYIDSTYQNKLTDTYPVVYLTENELFAKLYAYLRCYGNELKKFIQDKYKLPPSQNSGKKMVFLESAGGKPEVATVYVEVDESGFNISPNRQDAQLFSNDRNTKEFMVFRSIWPDEITKIDSVKEPLSQICLEILRTANPESVKLALEYKAFLKKRVSSKYRREILTINNMYDFVKMMAESPEIDNVCR